MSSCNIVCIGPHDPRTYKTQPLDDDEEFYEIDAIGKIRKIFPFPAAAADRAQWSEF